MLPKSVAENLKYGRPTSEMFESATVLFSEVRSSLWDNILPCFWACFCTMNHILFSWTSSCPRSTVSTTLHGPAALLSSLRCWTWSTRLLMHGWTNTTCTRQGHKHKYKYQPYMNMKYKKERHKYKYKKKPGKIQSAYKIGHKYMWLSNKYVIKRCPFISPEKHILQVETINDSYMVASGLPVRNGEKHVSEVNTKTFWNWPFCF